MLDLKALLDEAKAIRPDVKRVACEMVCGEGYARVDFYAHGEVTYCGSTEAELLETIRGYAILEVLQ
jgi:hypothetical protein